MHHARVCVQASFAHVDACQTANVSMGGKMHVRVHVQHVCVHSSQQQHSPQQQQHVFMRGVHVQSSQQWPCLWVFARFCS